MYTKRGFKLAAKNLPALPITPGINTIHYYVSVTHLHGVDSNSQSRIVPIHFIFLTAFIVCRAVLLGCPNSMDSHSYDENEYTHTDHNYDCGHTWNNWNKSGKGNTFIATDQAAYKTLNTLSIFHSLVPISLPPVWDCRVGAVPTFQGRAYTVRSIANLN